MNTELRGHLDDYLSMRRSLGFGLVRDEKLLRQFLDWLDTAEHSRVTAAAALAWIRSPVAPSSTWLAFRARVVRGFAAYLHSIDTGHEPLPPGVMVGKADRAVPYLYSDTEITAIMRQARQLKTPIRRATAATWIGLLAVTGMRVGEVIGLDDEDYDGEQALLTVRHAKLGKHRLLPLHPSTIVALDTYRRLRDDVFPTPVSPALLVSDVGTRLLYCNVSNTYNRLTRSAGLRPRSPRCRPRIHDLRHTFAVTTLLDWYRDGGDVAARLPKLSTWLGHIAPANTYWYLEAAPELLAEAARRLEAAQGGQPS